MSLYLHVYRAPSGQYSGKVLEEVAGVAGCDYPVQVLSEAVSQFNGLEDLPKSLEIEDLESQLLLIPDGFRHFCQQRGLTAEQVLTAFMADLAELEGSNGSDERRLADAWFDRVIWPEPTENDERMMKTISEAERQERQEAVDYAKASVGLEGFKLSEEDERHAKRFISGEIDLPTFIKGWESES